MINKQEVSKIQVGMKTRFLRVTSPDHFVIPAQCESVIDVYVERHKFDDFLFETEYLIEPTEHFQEKYPLSMAATLVDINKGCTCRVRILNPYPTALSIKQDAVVGQAVPIEGKPMVLIQQESNAEQEIYLQIRRIDFEKKEEIASETSHNTSRKVVDESFKILPEHLVDLHQRASTDMGFEESQKVANLLNRFQDCFSKDEWDLGLTHLAEHKTKTENAAPVKQSPRRVPLAYADNEKAAIEELKAKRVIRESISPWASPIVKERRKC